jgi:predicted site-specific integrase-resolvase
MKEWLTVPEAALLVGRDKSSIWKWVRAGKLRARTNELGTREVRASDVRRVEANTRRGRPTGTARTE